MANQSVLELAVGTGKWDSGLKKAQESLNKFVSASGGLDKALQSENEKISAFVKMMGDMTSKASTAKGQMNDYKRVLEQLTAQYNSMSQSQKNTIGQEFLQSIDKIKIKFQDAKSQVEEFNRSLGDIKAPEIARDSSVGLFGGKGLTDMLAVAGGNLMATGISKLTSEMTETVQQSIELAKSGEGVRLAFERLNRPGLLNNLKEATHGTVSELELMKAAVKFDDFKLPVEQLGTLLAFAQKKAKDTGQSVDYMVDSIVTGLGRKSLMILDNLGLSASQVKDRMKETGDMTSAVASIIKEQMAEAGEYIETAADRAARAAADVQNQMEELGRQAMPVAEEFATAWNEIKLGGMSVINFVLTPIAESLKDIREILSGEYTLKIKAEYDTPLGSNVDDKGNYIKRPANGNWAGFDAEKGTWKPGYTGAIYNSATGQTKLPEVTVTGNQKKTTPKTSSTSTTKVPTSGDFEKFLNKSMVNVEKLKGSDLPNTMSVWATMSEEAKKSFLDLSGAVVDMTDSFGDFSTWTKDFNPFDEMTKKLKQEQMAFNMAAQSATNFGAALAGIDDPSAKAAGTVISAIANIALGFGQAVASAGSMGPWAWLAYVAAGTAALATTISTVHSLTGYAEGGMIKGNSYSGDNIGGLVDGSQLVGLNAGEIVLNRAQQSNIAGQLQGGLGGMSLKTKVKGTELLVWLDNSLAQSGRGELVTWGP